MSKKFLSDQEEFVVRPWLQYLLLALVVVLAPTVITIFHRIYIHPLRKIPGPTLAAASDFYGFYHNFFKGGGYSKRFRDFHVRYGSPVIRIGPNHVHVNSPEFFEEVFHIGSKYSKDPAFYKNFGGIDSMLDPEDFRTYRTHISPLYSARSADGLTPRLLTELQAIGKRLEQNVGTGAVVNIQKLFRTLSADMVLRLLFPQGINLFEFDGYHPFLDAFDTIMTKTWLSEYPGFLAPLLTYPLVGMLLGLIPGSSFAKVNLAYNQQYCEGWANDAQLLRATKKERVRDSHMTRYLDIDPTERQKAKAIIHPLEDVFNFVAGGSDTTAYTMSCAVHYLLNSPGALTKLQAELDQSSRFIRGDFDHKKVQKLPYLNAVIKESLRLSSPVPGCLPRIVPSGGARVGSIYIPAGTAVSVSLLCLQQNEKLFPEPQKFRPERWLGEEGKLIEKWNIAFSRGPRQCVGTNIAYLELHSCLAYLFSHFELALPSDGKNQLNWVDRFVATNVKEVGIIVVKNRWI
ncbi:putative elymoclavine monooxygenase [Daldinia vernicosa]|uniref:putative elymoclavine monooxygenase n=1 Tax=Daldinia vernicosa TaxID=114800 RepID=UPI00200734F3|nr:putative elymoclavine monooxygenase [Daldinia vernicosa]KAI0848996.1 putative elymoclavine monooxygenase [Daldinia vernicosa]